jgi:DNA helicase-2/ATP-dependent DNA helicase PcrA
MLNKKEFEQRVFTPDEKQIEIINSEATQWLLVNAGPGTGKTQVSAMRLAHLLDTGLHPAQILVLSFSRSAVGTLSQRIASLNLPDSSLENLRHLAIRTFDAWAFRMLRQNGNEAKMLLQRPYDDNIKSVTALLRDDRATATHDRIRSIRHVIVDEFQDLPGVRSDMVLALLSRLNDSTNGKVGFTVLGDQAQAIYRFAVQPNDRVSETDPWVELKQRFAESLKEIELTINHRSNEALARQSHHMRQQLQNSKLNDMQKLEAIRSCMEALPAKDPDAKVGPEMLQNLPDGSIAILTRSNGEAVQVSKMLMGKNQDAPAVPVKLRLAGQAQSVPSWVAVLLGKFKPQRLTRSMFPAVYANAVKDLYPAILDHLHMPQQDVAWQRLLNASGAPDNQTSLEIAVLRDRFLWPDAFQADRMESEGAGVYISTIHQAKGMEFDNVTLLEPRKDNEKLIDPLEEANVGFVAITRAGQQLERMNASSIYRPPYEHEFREGRKRLVSWGQMFNVQAGLPGDIDPMSFVSSTILGSDEAVDQVQSKLLKQGDFLLGQKVRLRKIGGGKAIDTRYDIVLLKDGEEEGLVLGRTTRQWTEDLLDLLWKRNYHLPNNMYNLRIADVVTLSSPPYASEAIPDPWRTSRIWLGLTLTGTADFKGSKRNGK